MTERRARWRWPLIWAAVGIATFVASRLLMREPGAAEAWYAQGLGPVIARPLSRLTGLIPFSLGEVLLLAYALWLAILAGRGVSAATRRGTRWRDVTAAGVRRTVRDAGIVIFLFYVLWGFNYARPTLETRLGWPAWDDVGAAELSMLARASVEAANAAYLELHGTEDAGAPTRIEDPAALEAAVDGGWRIAAERLDLPARIGARYGRVKRPLLSEGLARLGITGIYFPFTAEAHVVRALPGIGVPVTMGHEKAHQRGVSSEAEASFLGWLAAGNAADPVARYSAAVLAHRQLVAALAPVATAEARHIAGQRLPGVRRDLLDLAEYVNRYRGVARAVGTAVNDRYLRANRVPGGVRNYSHATRLLITWSRRTGSVAPTAAQETS